MDLLTKPRFSEGAGFFMLHAKATFTVQRRSVHAVFLQMMKKGGTFYEFEDSRFDRY
ncbi:MAG: hypothetical protein M1418_00755 [Deltaproteobacteria bacterium]|nr:hypothetical protein [Deltaproteobacteria bacterium]